MPIATLSDSDLEEIEERMRKNVVKGDDITGYMIAFAYGIVFTGLAYIFIKSELNICAPLL